MKQVRIIAVIGVLGSFAVFFQNCGGSLNAQNLSVAANPLSSVVRSSSVGAPPDDGSRGECQQPGCGNPASGGEEKNALSARYAPSEPRTEQLVTITATGGSPPYSFQLLRGAGRLDGNVYRTPSGAEVALILVTDADRASVQLSINVVLASNPPQARCELGRAPYGIIVEPVRCFDSSAVSDLGVTATAAECAQRCAPLGTGTFCLHRERTNHCYACLSGSPIDGRGAPEIVSYGTCR